MKYLFTGLIIFSQFSLATSSNWICGERDQNKDHWYIASVAFGRDSVLRLETFVEGIYGGGVYGREPVSQIPSIVENEITFHGKTVTLKISKTTLNGKHSGKFTFTEFGRTHTKEMLCTHNSLNE